MAEKTSILQLIEGLRRADVYDKYSTLKLDILAASTGTATDIGQKERDLTRQIFGDYIDKIHKQGTITFSSLSGSDIGGTRSRISCNINSFLGLGNMGPVYAVTVDDRPFALKIYAATKLREIMGVHGKFGLGGILHDMESRDRPALLSDLGKRVLAKKPKGVYARCRRMVKVHDVGIEGDFMFVLMDLLEVDPIGKLDPAKLGGSLVDVVSWAVDCCVALCHLHVEEGRLHLNIRPEAFIRHAVKDDARQPKFCFFHYPKKFYRPEGSPCLETEFIMVDHLDTSVDLSDRSPKGLATVGSWPFLPPEQILLLLKTLRTHYDLYVEKRTALGEDTPVIKLKRSQMDDIWALGLTFYQFLCGGKNPFGQPKTLADMVNSILLTKFDFSPLDPRIRDLISSMLEKDPMKRFQRILDGCPEKMKSRKVLAEALLYKLEAIGLQCEGEATSALPEV